MADLFMNGDISRAQIEYLLQSHREKRQQIQDKLLLDSHTTAGQLMREYRKNLPMLFRLIRTQNLSEADFEALWKISVKQAVIREDSAVFTVADGTEISIPRLHRQRWKFFPEWEIPSVSESDDTLPFEPRHPQIVITYYSGESRILHQDEHFIFRTE